jgi:hypothetical protein
MDYEEREKVSTARTRRKPLITQGEFFSKIMDSEAAHTSFGRLILGDEKSAPLYCNSLLI